MPCIFGRIKNKMDKEIEYERGELILEDKETGYFRGYQYSRLFKKIALVAFIFMFVFEELISVFAGSLLLSFVIHAGEYIFQWKRVIYKSKYFVDLLNTKTGKIRRVFIKD
jgi:hypothetical protein